MNLASRNSGAALLTVLVALLVITIMLFEFQYSAMVERKLAYNELNQIQAYYLAKSGARLGLLRVNLYMRAKRDSNVKNLLKNVPQASGFIDAIWNMPLPAFPPDAEKLDTLAAPDKDAAERVLNQTRVSDGKSTHVISDESTKINLNDLVVPPDKRNDRVDFRSDTPQGHFWYTGRLLINLIDNFLRESESPAEEYRELRPEDLVNSIMDWVTPGDQSFNGGPKDSFYEKQAPPYKAKRNRLYTLNELKMVQGIDDTIFNKLRPHVTVFADQGRININTTSREDFYRALLPSLRSDDVKKILEERDRRGGWSSEDEFVQYLKGNFGNSDFDKLYPKKEEYPFSVGSQSFMIEALGKINLSKSSIQKIIRIGVALKPAGANCDVEIVKCQGVKGCFPDRRSAGGNKCKAEPRNKSECELIAGLFSERDGRAICTLQGDNGQVQETDFDPKTEAPPPGDFNALKIVQWSEA